MQQANVGTRNAVWKAGFSTLAIRLLDLPSRYGFHFVVAWKLGIRDAGTFYIVFGLLTLAAGVGRLGIDRALTREIAKAAALDRSDEIAALVRRGLAIVLALSIVAGVALAIFALLLAPQFYPSQAIVVPILYAGVAIVPLCVSAAAAGALAGLHRLGISQMVYSWLWPTLYCIAALLLPLRLDGALALLAAAATLNAAVALLALSRILEPGDGQPCDLSVGSMIRLGWSLFSTEISQLALSGAPAIVLGMVASADAVGIFALSWRVAMIPNLIIVAVAAMASPRLAHSAARRDGASLRATSVHALALVLGLGIAPLVVLMVGAPLFLGIFGPDFARGALTLRLLLMGQMLAMLGAITPELLGMTDHERDMQRINNLSIPVFLIALFALSQAFGANGAALAVIAGTALTGLGAALVARQRLGFFPLGAALARLTRRQGDDKWG